LVARRPLIGVTGCTREIVGEGDGAYHVVGNKYLTGLVVGTDAVPVMIPSIGDVRDGGWLEVDALLDRLDGVLVTGSPTNVEPRHYEGPAARPGIRNDPERDQSTLPVIRAAVEREMPLLAICRGNQELNVALGGSLHQHLHELPGNLDHRQPPGDDLDVSYGPSHGVALTQGGMFADLARSAGIDDTEMPVNSLHSQGIDRLAPGLIVEAVAPDGVIEGVRVEESNGFAIGVQWHPEHRLLENAFSRALFAAFGDAARSSSAGSGGWSGTVG
jgi:putative glutamine amidotransferase